MAGVDGKPGETLRFRLWRAWLKLRGRYVLCDTQIPPEDIERAATLARERNWKDIRP